MKLHIKVKSTGSMHLYCFLWVVWRTLLGDRQSFDSAALWSLWEEIILRAECCGYEMTTVNYFRVH